MSPFEAFKKYLSMKLHFQKESYDYFRCNGKSKVSFSAFEKRRDKVFFHRLVKIYNDQQLEQLFLSNLLADQNAWVGDLVSPKGRDIFAEWKKTYQSLQYTFSQDILILHEAIFDNNLSSFDELFVKRTGEVWAPIVDLGIKKTIHLETFIILDKVLNCIRKLDVHIDDTILWHPYKLMCLKYSPFLVVDINVYKNILRENFLKKQLDERMKVC